MIWTYKRLCLLLVAVVVIVMTMIFAMATPSVSEPCIDTIQRYYPDCYNYFLGLN